MQVNYMQENGFYKGLAKIGVVPVVVLENAKDAIPMAKALVAGGLPVAEITFRTVAAADCIKEISSKFPDILIGAGTVLNLSQAKRAVDAGAKFLVSPGTDKETVLWAEENKINIIPAAVTPSEHMWLINNGIDVTKFFPAQVCGGVKAINALASVFKGHKFMPTGGVNDQNFIDFLSNEAVIAVGGTWMVKPKLFSNGNFGQVQELASQASKVVKGLHR